MSFESGFDEKIDVIDLIINVLKDHEQRMDELISKLEITQSLEPKKTKAYDQQIIKHRPILTVMVSQWSEFREKCSSANLVTFDEVDKRFIVQALCNGVLFTYTESIPDMEINYKKGQDQTSVAGIKISHSDLIQVALEGKLECGLGLMRQEIDMKLFNGESIRKISYKIDSSITKSWIAYQLGIERITILQGNLQI